MAAPHKFLTGKLSMGPHPVQFDGNPVAGFWVQHAEGVCGGAARIRNTRYTIWGLVEWRQLGLSDAEILARYPDLTQGDLHTAWGYYEQHREEVDRFIRENQEA